MLFLKQDQELVPQVLVKGEHADGEIVRIGDVDEVIEKPIDFMFPFNLDLQHFLSGRSLLLEEVPFSLYVSFQMVL